MQFNKRMRRGSRTGIRSVVSDLFEFVGKAGPVDCNDLSLGADVLLHTMLRLASTDFTIESNT